MSSYSFPLLKPWIRFPAAAASNPFHLPWTCHYFRPKQIGYNEIHALRPVLGQFSNSSRPVLGQFSASSQTVFGQFSASSRPKHGQFSASSQPVLGQFSVSSRPVLDQNTALESDNESVSDMYYYYPCNARNVTIHNLESTFTRLLYPTMEPWNMRRVIRNRWLIR